MTEAQALYQFFNSFDIPAYPSTSVPNDTTFPWMTYENKYDLPFGSPVSIAVNLWYHTDSENVLNTKVKEIANRIGRGGTQIPYDGGSIWITTGTPFSIASTDPVDSSVKSRQLNLNLLYH